MRVGQWGRDISIDPPGAGDSRHVQLLLTEKRISDVIELGRALKRLVDKDQRDALKEACRRCRR